jgi:putative intracellular protease/amidase
MGKLLCFFSDEMADFEVVLAFHILCSKGSREIVSVGNTRDPVVSQSGFTYLPQATLPEAMEMADVEGLIIPGGPIRPQRAELTRLIQKLDGEGKLLAAICFGPQYLGRAGVLDRHPFTTSCSVEKIQALGVPDPYPRRNYVEERVVCDGNLITAKGHAFVDFAFAIADYLGIYAGKAAERQAYYRQIMDRY